MALTKPSLPVAVPGAPVMADDWNEVRDKLLELYDHLLAQPTQGTIYSSVRGETNQRLTGAAVYAVSAENQNDRHDAVAVGDAWVIADLAPGTYKLFAECGGYLTATRQVIISAGQKLSEVFELVPASSRTTMPSVEGSTLAQAVTAIQQAGISSLQIRNGFDESVNPAGIHGGARVTSQDPVSGADVAKADTTARLRVEALVGLPALVGKPLKEAMEALRAAGLCRYNIINPGGAAVSPLTDEYTEANVEQVKLGSQVLNPGDGVPVLQLLTVRVEGRATMPDVVNMPLWQAVATLNNAGFLTVVAANPAGTQVTPDDALYNGARVTAQSQPKDTNLATGTQIALNVEGRVTMPNVVGSTLQNAMTAVNAVATVNWVAWIGEQTGGAAPADLPAGYVGATVVDQSPAAGPTAAGQNATLTLRMVRVPNFFAEEDPRAVAASLGLYLTIIPAGPRPSDGQGRLEVWQTHEQDPDAGVITYAGRTVTMKSEWHSKYVGVGNGGYDDGGGD